MSEFKRWIFFEAGSKRVNGVAKATCAFYLLVKNLNDVNTHDVVFSAVPCNVFRPQ